MPTVSLGSPVVAALELQFGCIDLARPFLFSIAAIAPVVALWTYRRGAEWDGLKLALFTSCMIAVLLARSVAAFALSWEFMALVSLFLVATYHRLPSVRRALLSYGAVSQLGAVAIVVALALLGTDAPSFRFDDIAGVARTLSPETRDAVLVLVLIGFGSKAGLVPLHFWLPRAHPAAPANASALLSGVMLNVAIFGLMLVCTALAAPAPAAFGIAVVAFGGLSAVAGALLASLDSEVKRLLAYSSIENVGVVVTALGIALVANAFDARALAALATVAALFHAVNHGMFKSALFLSAGTLAQTAGTTDLEHLGGLWRLLPFSTVAVFVASMAAAALPPANGFASEWLVFRAIATALQSPIAAVSFTAVAALVAIALGGGLAAVAATKLFAGGFLGANRSTHRTRGERFDVAALAVLVLGAAMLLVGLVPSVALAPLAAIAATIFQTRTIDLGTLPVLPASVALLPIAGALASVFYARARSVRAVPTWTCGSPVARRAGYTPYALVNPVRRIFGEAVVANAERDAVRFSAFVVQRAARRLRVVQSGLLRVYLVYAAAAVIAVLVIAR
jgi:formate hydrogenlyase subunit 3/multisubunit Na+/H+ antiporter MnhD subunit